MDSGTRITGRVRVRRPFGARGMSSVRYGIRLGDFKKIGFFVFQLNTQHTTLNTLHWDLFSEPLADKGLRGSTRKLKIPYSFGTPTVGITAIYYSPQATVLLPIQDHTARVRPRRPCVKVTGSSRVPAPPWVGSRSPDHGRGSDPPMSWWLGLAPATLKFRVRFPNERNQGKQAHPVSKYRVLHGSNPPTRTVL